MDDYVFAAQLNRLERRLRFLQETISADRPDDKRHDFQDSLQKLNSRLDQLSAKPFDQTSQANRHGFLRNPTLWSRVLVTLTALGQWAVLGLLLWLILR